MQIPDALHAMLVYVYVTMALVQTKIAIIASMCHAIWVCTPLRLSNAVVSIVSSETIKAM